MQNESHRKHRTLGRTVGAILVATLLVALFVGADRISRTYQQIGEQESLSHTAAALAELGSGLIEMSLERSIVQVTLTADDPIGPPFSTLLAEQRRKANEHFAEALRLLDVNVDIIGRETIKTELNTVIQEMAALRRTADAELSRSRDGRNPEFALTWPDRVPALIERLERSSYALLNLDQGMKGSKLRALDARYQAWRIREFGGRARTYFAIAALHQRPLNETEIAKVRGLSVIVQQAIAALRAPYLTDGLNGEATAARAKVLDAYATRYLATERRLLDLSLAGKAPDIAFMDYFTESSAALGTAETLFKVANDSLQEESRGAVRAAWRDLAIIAVLQSSVLVMMAYLMWYLRRRIFQSLQRLQEILGDLTDEKYDRDLKSLVTRDEIGDVVGAVDVLRERSAEAAVLRATRETEERAAAAARRAELLSLIDHLEQTLAKTLDGVMTLTGDVQREMRRIHVAASDAYAQSRAVADGANKASAEVASVAAVSEELSASFLEITRNIQAGSAGTVEAADQVSDSKTSISRLEAAAASVTNVVQVINEIADQTNLLALNATIEAARAGEAGKGFSVVASEVKTLATATRTSTTTIGSEIDSMRVTVGTVVQAAESIGASVNGIKGRLTAIAEAAEQQLGAVREMTSTINRVASVSSEVSQRVTSISDSAKQTEETATNLTRAMDGLSTQLTALREDMHAFIQRVRSDHR